jgi:GT2 family glycosyltransferase
VALSALRDAARTAWQDHGLAAIGVLIRYGRMTLINRMAHRQVIRAVPRALDLPGSAAPVGSADIVVPIYNNARDLAGLLAALEHSSRRFGRIILVNDASTDPTIAPMLAAFAARVPDTEVLTNSANAGFVATANRGMAASQRDCVLLNTDIVLPDGALERLLIALWSDPANATATPFSNCAYGVGVPDLIARNALPFGATAEELDRSFATLRRRALEAIGPFDARFGRGYGEEADFCLRAAAAGFCNVLAPSAFVLHAAGGSFTDRAAAAAREGAVRLLSLHPHYPGEVARYLRRGEARAVGLAAMTQLLLNRYGMTLAALREAAAGAPASLTVRRDGARLSAVLGSGSEQHRFAFATAHLFDDALALLPAKR